MLNTIRDLLTRPSSSSIWLATEPVRAELFGLERLEEHAISLAKAQQVAKLTGAVMPLHQRLRKNSAALLAAYRDSAAEVEKGHLVVPAAEWLLDNYHLVEEQVREIKDDLPLGYYRQLPKLANGPFAGYPRVFGIVWSFVAHTDSHFDPEVLSRFILAYQSIQVLTIGELWATAITLRIVLIENLRRLAEQITVGGLEREDANQLSQRLLMAGCAHSALQEDIASRSTAPLSEVFAAQLAKRLRDQDPKTTPALEWLEQRLSQQGVTIDEVVQHAQQRQGSSNVSIRNIITSMRLISDIDWSELFEKISIVDVQLGVHENFTRMDFPTRNLYRSAIEQLARGSHLSEVEIASSAVQSAQAWQDTHSPDAAKRPEDNRLADPGYYLIDQGRIDFENKIGYRPTLHLLICRLHIRLGVGGYSGSIVTLALAFLCLPIYLTGLFSLPVSSWLPWIVAGFIPATEAASIVINRLVSWRFGAMRLPGLELKAGVPSSLRTLIVVPTLLTNEEELLQQVEHLEVHYLSGIDGDVSFALLTDGSDATQAETATDAPLLTRIAAEIAILNSRHKSPQHGQRFYLLHRRRLFNAGENIWMGWERKRGKLHELNRLLRGATDTSYTAIDGVAPSVPADVRYVITLDSDTRLPREAAMRLIGKMAHPLNRPRFDPHSQRVLAGYGIMQPRVTPSLPVGDEGSLYQRMFSSPGGIDPYAAAISDVYQDLFAEGSYTGKGIYDVDAFEAALAGRVKDNTMLSHDLYEGIFARAGLVSDVEVVEEFPARYELDAKRQHRWIRGDWQLLPLMFSKTPRERAMTRLGRWKVIDNLRRSLVAPTTLLALTFSWLLPTYMATIATALLLSTIALGAFIPCLFSFIPRRTGINNANHFRFWLADVGTAFCQTFFSVAFLADHSWKALDAIGRTLVRVFISHRHRLQWLTAAHCNATARPKLCGIYQSMAGGVLLGLLLCAVALFNSPTLWPLITPFALLWCFAPLLALCVSRPPRPASLPQLDSNSTLLRLTARRTWRYFESFVTPAENMLPPDNFQEDPEPVVAHRTSPTNIGLYLLSSATAHDFGWTGLLETTERLEATFASLHKLHKYNGHFFNWYDTQTLSPLLPEYISSVDSGNLAGHLIALANTCEEWANTPAINTPRMGFMDNVQLAREALTAFTSGAIVTDLDSAHPIVAVLDDIAERLNSLQSFTALAPVLIRLTEKAGRLAAQMAPTVAANGADHSHCSDLVFWLNASHTLILEQQRDQQQQSKYPGVLANRLRLLAQAARQMAMAMDFAFLLNPERTLLSIGYCLEDNSLDPSCYDLLASEARLASLFAIAKGDVATKHWFRLGRTATPMGKGSALISWAGSMFEYLMPSLVMRAPSGSLLEQTNRLIVQRQQQYGAQLGIPWGMSESAYNARDIEFTYQYSNFGVPGLGLKRGLSGNTVVAPYATGLATMVDAQAAVKNYRHLEAIGACGRFGFYEALDFTLSRLPAESDVAIVRSFMAHHQGMTIVAIANTLHNGQVRRRFHQEPMIQACELLLQERVPRDVAISHPRAEEVKIPSATLLTTGAPTVRRLSTDAAPATHLLSNGHYTVMLTATGAGYSRWRDLAVTRWQEDTTCNPDGSFIVLRDLHNGKLWSSGGHPLTDQEQHLPGTFEEDHAEFFHQDGSLTTTMNILVSGEDDGEVRRISLANHGRNSREIELTSYLELVLTTPSTDNAHPAFAKMFVETEYIAEYGALVATRRLRSPDEAPVWAAHFAITEGDVTADPQYETSRADFIGRGNTIATAAAFNLAPVPAQSSAAEGKRGATQAAYASVALGNTVGTVLDPIFSLRYRLTVPPGGTARVAFWTLVAASRAELLDLIDRHHDRSAYDRAKTLAWTQAQVQLRHLDISSAEAAEFQTLAAPILYSDPRFRVPAEAINRGMARQSVLWSHALSGDLPIVLLRIDDVEDIKQVKQLLRAHEYWRMKRLSVDLVIINEHSSSYRQELHIAIETAVRSSQSCPRLTDAEHGAHVAGSVHVLRADQMSLKARDLLKSVARVVMIARQGTLKKYLARLPAAPNDQRLPNSRSGSHADATAATLKPSADLVSSAASQLRNRLEFFNGYGGFAKDGCEYSVILEQGAVTPAPWINVIANAKFGFHVAAEGSGYSWAENSRENQLTPWSNDPISNRSGEAIYVRDEDSLALFAATAKPVLTSDPECGPFIAHHGYGYSRFEHHSHGIALSLLQYVPLKDPIKISRLTLHNLSGRHRRLSVTAYTEWVLGKSRSASATFITTQLSPSSNALLIQNRWSVEFAGRVAFADMSGEQTAWTTDRTEFLGRNGTLTSPAALSGSAPLSGTVGAGHDPCTAQQQFIELAPNESVEVVMLMGQCASAAKVRLLLTRYRQINLDTVLDEVKQYWSKLLGAVQVTTPDRAMDILLNGWLLYQTLSCRILARSAFYQSSGAYGFRDQLQDGMALTFRRPELTREHILRAAGRQFVAGDVQHWWLPHSGQGVRTRISDDRVWLAFAVASYINVSGDSAILNEQIPFIEGPSLSAEQHDAYFQATQADVSATLLEHCALGLDQCLELTGEHGLPLMGTGDWNDGMNLVGEGGKGESVWLGWLLIRTIGLFAPLATNNKSSSATEQPPAEQSANQLLTEARVQRWQKHAKALLQAIETQAWDGQWYRRATFDDGSWLGTKHNNECQIDSIAQSWSVLSGVACPERSATAMDSVAKKLIKPEQQLALLFTPPFDKSSKNPGYIKGYPPGLRENGGQYSHAAMWTILAYVNMGEAQKAYDVFSLLNPINHSLTLAAAKKYTVEPYAVAADVYSVAPHVGRGGWTWYTGAAGWMHRAGVEGILGINREANELTIRPCIPPQWPGFSATIKIAKTHYDIEVKQMSGCPEPAIHALLDGVPVAATGSAIRAPLDGGKHHLIVTTETTAINHAS